jgi:hypothetical protein
MAKTTQRIFRPPLIPERVRSIRGQGFAFIPNRFLLDGFFAELDQDELLLYLLLVLVGDRNGLSYYHFDKLCSLLDMPVERYLRARNSLIEMDLLAFDGTRFQVLELPEEPVARAVLLRTTEQMQLDDEATVRLAIRQSLRQADAARGGCGNDLEHGDSDDEQ